MQNMWQINFDFSAVYTCQDAQCRQVTLVRIVRADISA